MVCIDCELPPFHEVPEVLDCQVDAEELPVERCIDTFWFAELATEECQRFPNAAQLLLQDGPQSGVGSVSGQGGQGSLDRMMEKRGVGESFLGTDEPFFHGVGPLQTFGSGFTTRQSLIEWL